MERNFKGGTLNKYRNQKAVVDGITFDSRKEANKYFELKMLEKSGVIHDLKVHPKYLILMGYGSLRKRYYVADFEYREGKKIIVEDVKSEITKQNPTYRLKRQMFLVTYGNMYVHRES